MYYLNQKEELFKISIFQPRSNKTPRRLSRRKKVKAVLSRIALFDPIELFSPVVLAANVFTQKIWSANAVNYDDPILQAMTKEWCQFEHELASLSHFEIPRCIHPFSGQNLNYEIHDFGDASIRGNECALYIRAIELSTGMCHSPLLCSKPISSLKHYRFPGWIFAHHCY